jgi:hypothetical protein
VLAQILWNVQRALLRYFSVGFLLRTLLAHWRRDIVRYDRSSLGSLFVSWAWNQISRGIGFVVRSAVLAVWLCLQIPYVVLAVFLWFVFTTAPFLIAALIAAGIYASGF